MSFRIILIIMLICGIIGGFVNFLLPANSVADSSKKFVKPLWQCIVLGIGATLLIPLFLEIAQSKLMEGIRFDFSLQKETPADTLKPARNSTDTLLITNTLDISGNKLLKSDTTKPKSPKPSTVKVPVNTSAENSEGKSYLLFAAYCLLAAAAGFKFINMLINNVVKEKELSEKNNKIENLEKEQEKRTKNAQISQQQEEQKIREDIVTTSIQARQTDAAVNSGKLKEKVISFIPVLPAVTHADDPQKGRFGGKSEKNDRKLSAKVSESSFPGFYNVELTVESTNMNKPLNTPVIFYLHDSFSPSVYTIEPDKFEAGKACDDEILSYGAFTAGIITDNGETFLELDLSEDKSFPKEFRER